MTDFMPVGYEKLISEKAYINPAKLAEGEHKFRIVIQPVAGWLDWKDNKPIRYRAELKPKTSFNPEKPFKPFWAVYVWSYEKEGLYIMEITQAGLLRALTNLGNDEEWGDFRNYDIKIKKEGSGKDSKYSINPVPPKPMSDNIKNALKRRPVRLDALYAGKDPWMDLSESSEERGVTVESLFGSDSPEEAEALLEEWRA